MKIPQLNLTLRARLLLSFVAVVVLFGFFSSLLGIGVIHRSLPQLKDILAIDLSAAREILRLQNSHITDAVGRLAQQPFLIEHLKKADIDALIAPLDVIRQSASLDILVITDARGEALLRVTNPMEKRGDTGVAAEVRQAVRERKEVSSPIVFSGEELVRENPVLANRAKIETVSTSYARSDGQEDVAAGLVITACAPILESGGQAQGAVCGGQLLNRQTIVVDRIRNYLYPEEKYEGRDVAVVAIFLGDKRIATSVKTPSGNRAVGTLVSEQVYDRVLGKGERWVDRGFVINDWYLTAYEPIKDLSGRIVGILGLGLLERKFEATEQRASKIFLALTIAALVLAVVIAYVLLNSIMRPMNKLIAATEKIAEGASLSDINLDRAPPEIEAVERAFNRMLAAIRERNQLLRRQTQEKLIRSDRLAMVGQLAAGVAHEINNPLGSILLFSRLLMKQVPPDGRAKENLDRIEKETKRCHAIVQSLLDFARQREPKIEPVHVNQLLDETLKLFDNQFLFHNIEVVKNYSPSVAMIQADQSQLQQVIMNIIMNAVDAMNAKGRLSLETKNSEEEGAIEVCITDTGCGIPPENINRIFDPFFTTKGVGQGTGLGLSISYGIIQRHDGDLSVSSAPGSGSTFTITLPIMRSGN
jgi:two-component system NtrC family sensor kinase